MAPRSPGLSSGCGWSSLPCGPRRNSAWAWPRSSPSTGRAGSAESGGAGSVQNGGVRRSAAAAGAGSGEGAAEPQPTRYIRAEQERRAAAAQRQLDELGKVNPLALEEFAALEERHSFLATQLEDLKKTRRDLLIVVKE